MAEFDDERPDFDAVFRDPPDDEARAARRRATRGGDFDVDDGQSTGEVPRPDLGAPASRPIGGDSAFMDFGEDDPEPEPAPRSRRGGASSRPRSPRAASRSGSSSGSGSGGSSSRPRSTGGSRSRSGGRRPSGSGGASVLENPRARLLMLIAFAVVAVVVIAFVVKDCQKNQLKDSYTQYVNGVAQLVTKSAAQGADLRKVMSNPRGDTPPVLKTKIAAIAKEAQVLVDQADALDPPGSLSAPQRSLVAGVLEYRVTGLTTLANGLPTLLQGKDTQTKAAGIAAAMKRFLASDVIYEDSFIGPATEALKKDDITGIKIPPPQPFLPNPALASPDGAKSLLPALQRTGQTGGGTGGTSSGTGNLRGMSLESTVAAPSDTRLTVGQTASVQSTELLKWQVTVKNGGDFDETNVIVRASFSYPATPNDINKQEVAIPSIKSGESLTVEIPGPPTDKVTFGDQGTLRIEVVPVTGETRIDNNSADYPVKITI